MTTFISALTRTVRRIRRCAKRLSRRLTRKAELKLGITVSLPPFLKFAFDYKADIGEPANDNAPRQPGRTARAARRRSPDRRHPTRRRQCRVCPLPFRSASSCSRVISEMRLWPRSFRWACNSVNRSASPTRSSSGTDGSASHARNTRTASTTRYLGVSHGLYSRNSRTVRIRFGTAPRFIVAPSIALGRQALTAQLANGALNPGSVEWATLRTPCRFPRAGSPILTPGPDVRACPWGEDLGPPSSPASRIGQALSPADDRAQAGARRLTGRESGPWSLLAPQVGTSCGSDGERDAVPARGTLPRNSEARRRAGRGIAGTPEVSAAASVPLAAARGSALPGVAHRRIAVASRRGRRSDGLPEEAPKWLPALVCKRPGRPAGRRLPAKCF